MLQGAGNKKRPPEMNPTALLGGGGGLGSKLLQLLTN
jgi:hypothetical protein